MGPLRQPSISESAPTDIYSEFAATWHRLEIHAQDIFDITDGSVFATEALPRWRSGPTELWAAGAIFPIAAEIGLVDDYAQRATELSLTTWADSAARQHAGRLVINIHSSQLSRPNLTIELARMLERSDVSAAEVIIKVADSAGHDACRAAVDSLGSLIDVGITIAIADHPGEASQSRPSPEWLPAGSIVHLDPALTMWADEPLGRDLLEATADELHAHGYNLVAEAIDRPSQLAAVAHCHIGYAQGYLYATPATLI